LNEIELTFILIMYMYFIFFQKKSY